MFFEIREEMSTENLDLSRRVPSLSSGGPSVFRKVKPEEESISDCEMNTEKFQRLEELGQGYLTSAGITPERDRQLTQPRNVEIYECNEESQEDENNYTQSVPNVESPAQLDVIQTDHQNQSVQDNESESESESDTASDSDTEEDSDNERNLSMKDDDDEQKSKRSCEDINENESEQMEDSKTSITDQISSNSSDNPKQYKKSNSEKKENLKMPSAKSKLIGSKEIDLSFNPQNIMKNESDIIKNIESCDDKYIRASQNIPELLSIHKIASQTGTNFSVSGNSCSTLLGLLVSKKDKFGDSGFELEKQSESKLSSMILENIMNPKGYSNRLDQYGTDKKFSKFKRNTEDWKRKDVNLIKDDFKKKASTIIEDQYMENNIQNSLFKTPKMNIDLSRDFNNERESPLIPQFNCDPKRELDSDENFYNLNEHDNHDFEFGKIDLNQNINSDDDDDDGEKDNIIHYYNNKYVDETNFEPNKEQELKTKTDSTKQVIDDSKKDYSSSKKQALDNSDDKNKKRENIHLQNNDSIIDNGNDLEDETCQNSEQDKIEENLCVSLDVSENPLPRITSKKSLSNLKEEIEEINENRPTQKPQDQNNSTVKVSSFTNDMQIEINPDAKQNVLEKNDTKQAKEYRVLTKKDNKNNLNDLKTFLKTNHHINNIKFNEIEIILTNFQKILIQYSV